MKRREFLKRSAGAAAAMATITSPTLAGGGGVLGASERVRMGFMGIRGRGGSLMRGFASLPEVDAATICDVDARQLPGAVRAVADLKDGRKPETTGDFRKILDDKSIDALVVGTPDHWHALPTILACQAGKDVYVEKPASHTIQEGQMMLAAARKYERVVQVGIQSRSSPHHADAYDYIRSGKLGKVCAVKAWESSRQGSLGFPEDRPVPAGVDYDTWLGPAPERPFNPARFHSNWRWFFDYGTGDLGNDGVHRLDYALRGLNAAREAQELPQVGLPLAVAASGGKHFFNDCQEWPDSLYVTYDYPGATLIYEMRVWTRYTIEGEHEGAAVYGENGYVVIGNGRWRAYGPGGEVVNKGSSSINRESHDPAHKRNFLECVRTRGRPVCDIEIGHTTSVLCHAGNIAWRTGRKLRLDEKSQTFVDDVEANRFLGRTYRPKWALPARV